MKYLAYIALVLFGFSACTSETVRNNSNATFTANQNDAWADYWYAGDAEVSVFKGYQARYSEVHPAEAVLIFVTEDFLTDKQVKNESGQKKNSTSVLKTNMTRDFTTGIYDYSMMISVFTPVDAEKHPRTMKITTSSQDWCGQSYMQLNHDKNDYQVKLFSYFEKEGDAEYDIDDVLTEDEIMNRIRLNPDDLPSGQFSMIPSTIFARFKHIDLKPYEVQASFQTYEGTDFEGEALKMYILQYPELDRTVEIIYENNFPYAIDGWTDTYPTVSNGEKLTSIYKRISTVKTPYWSLHDKADMPLRSEMGL